MWGASLVLFLFLFILKSFVTMGNGYPTIHSIIKPAKNHIMTSTHVTPYTCVYIPPNLNDCNFSKFEDDPEHKLPEYKKHKLLENNKRYFTSRPSNRVPRTKKFQRQSFVKTIVYEITRCKPARLPFILPFCTNEDISDKKSEINRLIPFKVFNKNIV